MADTDTNLKYHQCKESDYWAEFDAQGIYLCKVCDICIKAKLSKYRAEVLTEAQHELLGLDEPEHSYSDVVQEPIEPEEY